MLGIRKDRPSLSLTHMIQPRTLSKAKSNGQASPSLLFHADSGDPDLLYFSRFRTSDPILAVAVDGKKIGLAVPMEYSRMRDESAFYEVLLLSEVREQAA